MFCRKVPKLLRPLFLFRLSILIDWTDLERRKLLHAIGSVDQIHRNMALIVVHSDDEIKLTANGLQEKRVGWKGATTIDVLLECLPNSRFDDHSFLISE